MHNTAAVVLLAWVFALASGVANACLLEPSQNSFYVPLVVSSGVDSPARLEALPIVGAGHGHALDASHAPCVKVCIDTSQSLPKGQAGVDETHPALSPPVAMLWATAVPAGSLLRRVADRQPVVPELPTRLRYSRLAL